MHDTLERFYLNANNVFSAYQTIRLGQLPNFRNDMEVLLGVDLEEMCYFMANVY